MSIWQITHDMGGFPFGSQLEYGDSKTIHLAAIISSSMEPAELPLPRNMTLDLPVAKMSTSLEMVILEEK